MRRSRSTSSRDVFEVMRAAHAAHLPGAHEARGAPRRLAPDCHGRRTYGWASASRTGGSCLASTHLRAVPAAVRFISAEPLLGPLRRPGPGRHRLADRRRRVRAERARSTSRGCSRSATNVSPRACRSSSSSGAGFAASLEVACFMGRSGRRCRFRSNYWAWLERERIAAPQDRPEFDRHFTRTQRGPPRPGRGCPSRAAGRSPRRAEALDGRGALRAQVREAFDAALKAFGEPPLGATVEAADGRDAGRPRAAASVVRGEASATGRSRRRFGLRRRSPRASSPTSFRRIAPTGRPSSSH